MEHAEIWRWLPVAMIVVAVGTAAAIWRLGKEIRRTSRRGEMFAGLTWTCHVCGDERPDLSIAVFKRDVSTDHGLPIGSMFTNVRHCSDRPKCRAGAEGVQWFAKTKVIDDGADPDEAA